MNSDDIPAGPTSSNFLDTLGDQLLGLDDIFEQDFLNASQNEIQNKQPPPLQVNIRGQPVGQRYVEEPILLSRRGRGSSQDGLSPLPTYSPQVQHFNKKQPQMRQWQTPPVINYGTHTAATGGGGGEGGGATSYGSTLNPVSSSSTLEATTSSSELAQLQANMARIERSYSNKREDSSDSRKPFFDDQMRDMDQGDLDNLLDALEIDVLPRKPTSRTTSDELFGGISPFTQIALAAEESVASSSSNLSNVSSGGASMMGAPQRRVRGSSADGLSPLLPSWSPQVQHFNKKQPPRGQWHTPPVINYGVPAVPQFDELSSNGGGGGGGGGVSGANPYNNLMMDNSDSSSSLSANVEIPFEFPMPRSMSREKSKDGNNSNLIRSVDNKDVGGGISSENNTDNSDKGNNSKLSEEERRDRRLARNRASARLRRQRKKLLLDALQVHVGILENMIKNIKQHEWGNADAGFLSTLVNVENVLDTSFNIGENTSGGQGKSNTDEHGQEGEKEEDSFSRTKYTSYDIGLGPMTYAKSLLAQQHSGVKNMKYHLKESVLLPLLLTYHRDAKRALVDPSQQEGRATISDQAGGGSILNSASIDPELLGISEELISCLQLSKHQVSALTKTCCPTDTGATKLDRFIAEDMMDLDIVDKSYETLLSPAWVEESLVAKWSDILTPDQRISFKKWITQNETAVRGLDIDTNRDTNDTNSVQPQQQPQEQPQPQQPVIYPPTFDM